MNNVWAKLSTTPFYRVEVRLSILPLPASNIHHSIDPLQQDAAPPLQSASDVMPPSRRSSARRTYRPMTFPPCTSQITPATW